MGAETPGGWAGDVTRTWPASGRYSSTQREIYEVVLAAQKQAIAAVTPGSRYRNVHVLACQALAAGLVDLGILRGDPIELAADGVVALLFPHGVGHLLGLDVHDMEDLGDRAGYAPGRERAKTFGLRSLRLDRDLEPGMAVTIEPGFYIVARDPRRPGADARRARPAGPQAARGVRRRPRHPHRRRRAGHRHRPRGAHRGDPEDHRRRRSRDGRLIRCATQGSGLSGTGGHTVGEAPGSVPVPGPGNTGDGGAGSGVTFGAGAGAREVGAPGPTGVARGVDVGAGRAAVVAVPRTATTCARAQPGRRVAADCGADAGGAGAGRGGGGAANCDDAGARGSSAGGGNSAVGRGAGWGAPACSAAGAAGAAAPGSVRGGSSEETRPGRCASSGAPPARREAGSAWGASSAVGRDSASMPMSLPSPG